MGTWGDGPFDDDGAADWLWELEESEDWGVVEAALQTAADVPADGYLEQPDGQIAWAAAAVVAAVDDASIEVPEETARWLSSHRDLRPATARPLALRALRGVLADNSQLVELWREAGEETTWRTNVEKLAAALR